MKLTDKKLARVTPRILADKELMKRLRAKRYGNGDGEDDTLVKDFADNAIRYINAVADHRAFCVIESVAQSGMSRVLRFLEMDSWTTSSNKRQHGILTFWSLFKALGFSEVGRSDGFRVHGCGMDMVFHTNYTIIHTLHRLGFLTAKQCKELAQKTPTVA